MNYKEWIASLSKHHYSNKEYYTNIVKYRTEIIEDIDEHNQSIVAEKLRMTQPKLGSILNILKVL